jgi:hypothetical protein
MVNAHALDRALRIVLGLAILSLTFLGPQTPWGLLGLVPLVTGVAGYCPLYQALGINTCRLSARGRAQRGAA